MTLQDESEAMDAVAKTVASARKTGANQAELTLSNGIVLVCRPVPPMLISGITAELERKLPEPPTRWLEDKQREEPNPNDPAYTAALARFERLNQAAVDDLAMAVSTTVKSVPEGYFGPEEDGWLNDRRIKLAQQAGLEFDPADEIKRHVVWLRYYAIEAVTDVQLWMGVRTQLTGINEDEVRAALATFRGDPPRPADNGSAAAPEGENGHRANRAARRQNK